MSYIIDWWRQSKLKKNKHIELFGHYHSFPGTVSMFEPKPIHFFFTEIQLHSIKIISGEFELKCAINVFHAKHLSVEKKKQLHQSLGRNE